MITVSFIPEILIKKSSKDLKMEIMKCILNRSTLNFIENCLNTLFKAVKSKISKSHNLL